MYFCKICADLKYYLLYNLTFAHTLLSIELMKKKTVKHFFVVYYNYY